jgi:cobalt/nickel transport system ATP-binding protein
MTNAQNTNSSADLSVPALSASELIFSYSKKRIVLQNIDLVIQGGERVGLIGPNGAGKTTFFMLACGVLKPNAGEITLFGKPLTAGQFHPVIGMIFQNSDDQLFSSTVWDDVAFGPKNLGLSNDEIADRVMESLTTTGVLALAERAPHHLSGGEKRMVSIAGVLAMQPRMIIYDEPSASLDMRARRRLIKFLQKSQETLLVASHDLELILEVCNRVILLDEGKIISDGCPRDIMSDVELMKTHGLERPHSLTFHSSNNSDMVA